MKKKLGIVGGLGPLAGAYFLELLTNVTNANVDQEHVDAILYSHASTPDRTAYILDKSKQSPVPAIIESLHALQQLGAENIAIACVTSHYFFDDFVSETKVPILNMPELTAAWLKDRGYEKAGILATTGTVNAGLFQTKLEQAGLNWAVPQASGQSAVMQIIYNQIKANLPYDQALFSELVNELAQAGCDCIILGCTELSLIKRELTKNKLAEKDKALSKLPTPLADAMEILAVNAALASGVSVKAEALEL